MRKLEFNDTELINLYKNGNEGAFATLVQRYKTRLLVLFKASSKTEKKLKTFYKKHSSKP